MTKLAMFHRSNIILNDLSVFTMSHAFSKHLSSRSSIVLKGMYQC